MKRRPVPPINAGSMADIAFLLLIFFLVATTIEAERGIKVLLPPYTQEEQPIEVVDERVLGIKINAQNLIMIETSFASIDKISEEVENHVLDLIAQDQQPIISIMTDTSATYETYIAVYNEVKSAYTQMRNEYAQDLYGKNFEFLVRPQMKVIIARIPMIISEADYY